MDEEFLERAYLQSVSLFSDCELTPAGVPTHLAFEVDGGQHVLDIRHQVVPPIAFALRHFGERLPASLIQKLRNRPQLEDTLFELLCLGMLAERHKVIYEPTFADGKVPDLLVELEEGIPLYVECKSHRFEESGCWTTFNVVISQVLTFFKDQPVAKQAREQKLRIELHLRSTPNKQQLEALGRIASTLRLNDLQGHVDVAEWLRIAVVPQTQPLQEGFSMTMGLNLIPTVWTRVDSQTSYVLAYSWPSLDKQRLRSQRELLRRARTKLNGMPAGAKGMICIQTLSSKRFLPELHRLIDQDQFARIPIIWLNPSVQPGAESKFVFRDEARGLAEILYPLLPQNL